VDRIDDGLSARVTVHDRVDREAARLALGAWASQRPAAPITLSAPTDRVPDAGAFQSARQSMHVSRLWLDPPRRWRHELTSDGEQVAITVVDQPRWWSFVPPRLAVTNADDPSADSAPNDFPYEGLFRPDLLLEGLDIRDRSSTTWRGIEVQTIVATPSDEDLHRDLPRAADRYEIRLDLKQGVIREVVASSQDHTFAWIEMVDVAFDVSLDPDIFVIDLPPGVTFEQPIPPLHRPTIPPAPPFSPRT
jgi:outer membrane lipoprotein-sorting protein